MINSSEAHEKIDCIAIVERHTSGTCEGSASDEAASVVTVRLTTGATVCLRRAGIALLVLKARENMFVVVGWWRRGGREDCFG